MVRGIYINILTFLTQQNNLIIFKNKKKFKLVYKSFLVFLFFLNSKITKILLKTKLTKLTLKGFFIFSLWFFVIINCIERQFGMCVYNIIKTIS